MHILIIPSLLYQTEYQPVSGIFQKHQADCLAAAGHRVGVLSVGLVPFKNVLSPNPYRKPLAALEGNVNVVRRYNKAFLPQRYLAPGQQARAMCALGLAAYQAYERAHGRPDVVHAHDCLYGGVLAKKLKEQYGLPYVLTEHSTLHLRGFYHEAHRRMIRGVLEQASAVTTVGSGLMGHFRAQYGDVKSVQSATLIYNLLDKNFENLPEELLRPRRDSAEEFVFLNVAHLVEQKAQVNLLRALPAVLKEQSGAQVRIGGAGPMEPALRQAIEELGLQGHAQLLGLLGRERVREEMAACDTFVLPSRVETFGVVLIEAMAMGKPVIATVCGGPEDFVDEASGYLVPAGDVDALAGAMLRMIENRNQFDPTALRHHCIDRFGSQAFLRRLEELYGQAMGTQG